MKKIDAELTDSRGSEVASDNLLRLRLARDGRGRPVLSLTVVLTRRPRTDEHDVMGLIDRGHLSFDVTLAGAPERFGTSVAPVTPSFTHSALFQLTAEGDTTELARARTSGPQPRVALTAALSATQTREVIDALSGSQSGMQLSVSMVLNQEPVRTRVSIEAAWADLYDAITLEAAAAPDFNVSVIEHALQKLMASGQLNVQTSPSGVATAEVMGVAIRGILRGGGMILAQTLSPIPGRYRLTERPAEEFAWHYEEILSIPVATERTITAPLERVLGGGLDGEDWSAFVRLVAPDGPSAEYSAVPRRSRGERERMDRDAGGAPISSMLMINATMVDSATVTATSRPVVRPVAMASGHVKQLWLPDGVLDYLGKKPVRHLPVTSVGDEILFPDRIDDVRRWYLPSLEIVEPNPAGDPETAAFLFSFERIGTSSTGEAALSGAVRITLRPTVSQQVKAALAANNNPPAQPVEMLDLNVEISVPFIDSADNMRKRTSLRGTVERSGGDIVVTFQVADRWVRLLYGVLSSPSTQNSERATIGYSFRYECYRSANGSTIRPLNGVKQASIPIKWGSRTKPVGPLAFDARAGVLVVGATHIKFASEEVVAVTDSNGREDRATGFTSVARPLSIVTTQPIVALRPEITLSRPVGEISDEPIKIRPPLIDIPPILPERVYVQQSIGVQGAADVVMPCNRFGSLYRQRLPTGWQALGCQDAFRLGSVSAQLYEEIGTLANEWFRVYRCLPQPSRFLTLPRTYRIARYSPEHERAYLPAAMVFAVLDPVSTTNNRYQFIATVEPDIPSFAMRALRASLCAYAPAASIQVDLPTDVATQTDLPSMPIASALSPPRFTVIGKGVQVVLECHIADALVLRSAVETGGVLGRLAFTLGDSSRLESDIEITLGQIGGPWMAGPISVDRTHGQVRLTNRIDRAIDVSLLRLYVAAAAATEIAVGRRLEALATETIVVDHDEAEVAVVYSIPSSGANSLEERRIYMEDVYMNVIFTCGINYSARGILDIEVYARLRGAAGEQRVTLSNGEPRTGTAEFIAPLSTVVASGTVSPVIEYRLVRAMTTGERIEKPWAACPGAMVDIQWNLVA